MLPTFLTDRIFALEYIRKRFISDHDHFSSRRATVTFHLPHDVGPFIAKHRFALDHVEKMLAGMHFPRATKWRYEPHYNIIYNIMKDQDRENHKYAPNIELERVVNMQTWEKVQAILASPLLSAEESRSTEAAQLATEVVDLKKEGSSTIGVKRGPSDPMDVDQETNKAKLVPKPNLQLLTYTRGKTTKTSSEARS